MLVIFVIFILWAIRLTCCPYLIQFYYEGLHRQRDSIKGVDSASSDRVTKTYRC